MSLSLLSLPGERELLPPPGGRARVNSKLDLVGSLMSRILLSSLSLSFPLFSLLATDRTLILLSPSPRPLAIYLSKANSVGGEGE